MAYWGAMREAQKGSRHCWLTSMIGVRSVIPSPHPLCDELMTHSITSDLVSCDRSSTILHSVFATNLTRTEIQRVNRDSATCNACRESNWLMMCWMLLRAACGGDRYITSIPTPLPRQFLWLPILKRKTVLLTLFLIVTIDWCHKQVFSTFRPGNNDSKLSVRTSRRKFSTPRAWNYIRSSFARSFPTHVADLPIMVITGCRPCSRTRLPCRQVQYTTAIQLPVLFQGSNGAN